MTMEPKQTENSLVPNNFGSLDLDRVRIKTGRLILRPVLITDADSMFQEFSPEITRYMIPKSPSDISETVAFIEDAIALRKKLIDFVVVILSKEQEQFLGVAGLHGRSNPKLPEFGIWLKKAAHGNGFGKEAIHGLYNWALDNLIVEGFIYPVDKKNMSSRMIPESLGGVVIKDVLAPTMSGGVLDEVVYKIPLKVKM